MASEVLRIRIRADAGNTAAVFNDISRNILGMTIGAAGAKQGLLGLGAALSGAQITGRLTSAIFGALAFGAINLTDGLVGAAGAQNQFRTNLQALLKDASQVTKVTAIVKEFADATAFSNEEVFQVAQNLIAAKVPLDNLIPTLQMLGDVSLGNAEKFSGIATAWYQIIAKGKLTAEEINQIAERGVSVWNILAEETGKTVPELQKLAEAGTLTVSTYMPLLQKGLAKNYAGSLKEASNLSTNLLANMGKSITNFRAAIGQGLEGTLNPALQALAALFRRAAVYAVALTRSEIWTRFTVALQTVVDTLLPMVKALGKDVFIAMVRSIQVLTPVVYLGAAAIRGIAYAATQAMQFLKPLADSFRRIAQSIKSLDWQGLYASIKAQAPDIGKRIKDILIEMLSVAWDGFRNDFLPTLRKLTSDLADEFAKAFKEDPVSILTAGVALWVLLGMQGVPAALAGKIGWASIIAAIIVVADIQEGIEKQDFSLIAQAIASAIAGAITAHQYGPVMGLAAVFLVGVVGDEIRNAFEKKQWEEFWGGTVALIIAGLALAFSSPGVAAAVLFLGPALIAMIIKQLKEDITKGDFTSLAAALAGGLIAAILLTVTTIPFATALAIAALSAVLIKVIIDDISAGLNKGDYSSLTAVLSAVLVGVVLAAIAAVPLLTAVAIGLAIALVVKRITKGIQDVFTGGEINWVELLSGVIPLLVGAILLLFTGVPVLIVAGIVAALAVIGPGIIKALGEIEWAQWGLFVKDKVIEAFNAISIGDWDGFFRIGGELMVGLWEGIIQEARYLWIKFKAWLASFTNDTREEWGVSSPSTVFMEIGKALIEGLYLGILQGIQDGWQALLDKFDEWGKSVLAWFSLWTSNDFATEMKRMFGSSSVVEAIKSGLSSAWESARSVLDKFIEGAKGAAQGAFNAIKMDAPSGASSSASTSAGNSSEDRDQKWRKYNFIKNTDGDQAADAYRRAEGFAMGGSFRVGGSGGTDSQLVQFRASPNETVTIRRPDQGGGGLVINTLNVYADSYQGGQDAARAIRDALGAQRRMMFATT